VALDDTWTAKARATRSFMVGWCVLFYLREMLVDALEVVANARMSILQAVGFSR